MERQEVELLGIGAGPANLALAVALEEMAGDDLAGSALLIEQHDDIVWQRGMLLPWTQSQVSFIKDLVTLRNPRSEYSFINYLHSNGRLDEFANLGSFTPYRVEISNYLRWVAGSLRRVGIEHGRRCASITPVTDEDGTVRRWSVRTADGGEIVCRDLVIGMGRDPHIPDEIATLPRDRVVHSTEFVTRMAELDRDATRRVVVVGAAQSAAEMFWAAHRDLPGAQVTMVMRAIGLNAYETSRFTNELFYPSFVDEFHASLPEAREQLLREMHRTNYAGLAPGMLDTLYREMYQQRLAGDERLHMITMTDIVDARMDGEEVVLTLLDRKSQRTSTFRCDLVLLGTGFVRTMPRLARDLAEAAGMGGATVDRNYRMNLPPGYTAGCYLQGVNEATHGIADSLLSVLAARSQEIVTDLLAHRQAEAAETSGAPALALNGR
ncbi:MULTISPECIES: lysine N(6)-hydroxylase/L-ornithine N(5)-oxygenase family protein [Thermomonosporaceae]|uniref:lysine N(6)-hydroxylase/L-ornithine N(5)-oxygenase family protein n=1 Tax=Thermomonosporaceae TaxID=2012 RepID=UPI00255AC0D8|nr:MULTISPECIES: SidA/IucD/PvdA family monooxygenase [Thermomonosporaceae]MDL4774176.1 SidA/IucD/PvdA family monooxygenase [Actinomadura xylanilytica]